MTATRIGASAQRDAETGDFVVMRIRPPETGSKVGLRYYEPAADLRGLASSYYIFRADLPIVADLMRADLGQLRFMLNGAGHYSFGQRSVDTAEVCLLGPSTAATRFVVAGPLLVFGISLQPAGWASLMREDASLIADGAIDAISMFGPLLADALDAMRAAPDPRTMVSIADVVMRAMKARATEPPLAFTRIADAWLTGAADPNVDALVAALNISNRQVERLTKRIYGAPPKLLARKYRTLRAASLIGAHKLHWSDAAGDAFFDQSHFIRDFKRFTGLTPGQFQKDPPPITRLTIQRRLIGEMSTLARMS